MNRPLRLLFFALIVRPLIVLALGGQVRGRDRLPLSGPAILAANHNSHLDTLTLLALFPLKTLMRVRPVAAADYFLKSRSLAWFATRIMGIIPLERGAVKKDPLADLKTALDRDEILVLFPEGSRGEPEQRAAFKRGVAYLAKARPDAPVTPVFMHGLGKALPKGSLLFVPFNCDVFVGEPMRFESDVAAFMADLEGAMTRLAALGHFQPWS